VPVSNSVRPGHADDDNWKQSKPARPDQRPAGGRPGSPAQQPPDRARHRAAARTTVVTGRLGQSHRCHRRRWPWACRPRRRLTPGPATASTTGPAALPFTGRPGTL